MTSIKNYNCLINNKNELIRNNNRLINNNKIYLRKNTGNRKNYLSLLPENNNYLIRKLIIFLIENW